MWTKLLFFFFSIHLLFLWFVCIGIKQYYKHGSTTKHENDQIKYLIYKKCHCKNCNLNNLDTNSFLLPIAVIFHLYFQWSMLLCISIYCSLSGLLCACVCVSHFGRWRKISSSIRISLMKYTDLVTSFRSSRLDPWSHLW